ncbi:hypothetical protein CQ969_002088 [Escherichia coli]|nr:hypothetical protein [Escherichia coli]EFC5350097.1 hypothetical protein [Escherichia coli]EFJ9740182.1 hypothetical protein [Escherichia coli]HAL3222751.1 hypothetical protein [Escherichia coli]HAN5821623.1 hypothetical protein [Escherichia coli]
MFPAPAGINRQPFSIAGVSKSVPRASGDKPPRKSSEPPTLSVPRASGDKPLQTVANAINKKCSPRQRG